MIEWRPITEFNGRYMVSNGGEIRSMPVEVSNGRRLIMTREIILKPAIDGCGYNRVGLMKSGKLVTRKVHRLVAQAFILNPLNKPQVNHINGIKTDNRVENLEWATQSENMIHSLKTGLKKMPKGGAVYNAKPIYQYTLNMSLVYTWECASTAAETLNFNSKNIRACANMRRRSANGFIWRFV